MCARRRKSSAGRREQAREDVLGAVQVLGHHADRAMGVVALDAGEQPRVLRVGPGEHLRRVGDVADHVPMQIEIRGAVAGGGSERREAARDGGVPRVFLGYVNAK